MKTRDVAWLALGAASNPSKTEYVTKTVIEKRAPTDDSIRLAREYEEKAWAAVSNRIVRDIKPIDAQVVYCEKQFDDRSKRLLFTVNGRKVDVRLNDGYDGNHHIVYREMAEAITAAILTQLLIASGGKL